MSNQTDEIMKLLKSMKYKEVLDYIESLLVSESANEATIRLKYYQVVCHFKLKNHTECIESANRTISDLSLSVNEFNSIMYMKAYSLVEKDDIQQAITTLSDIKVDTKSSIYIQALILKSLLFLKQESTQELLECLLTLSKLTIESQSQSLREEYEYLSGIAYARQGEPDRALNHLQDAVALMKAGSATKNAKLKMNGLLVNAELLLSKKLYHNALDMLTLCESLNQPSCFEDGLRKMNALNAHFLRVKIYFELNDEPSFNRAVLNFNQIYADLSEKNAELKKVYAQIILLKIELALNKVKPNYEEIQQLLLDPCFYEFSLHDPIFIKKELLNLRLNQEIANPWAYAASFERLITISRLSGSPSRVNEAPNEQAGSPKHFLNRLAP